MGENSGMADAPAIDIGGQRLSLVGLGTFRLRGSDGYDAIRYALEVGYRHIDTATMYRNEAEVGRAIGDSDVNREDVFITTKLPAERAGQERRTLEASLDALGTDHVDLWLIHWPPRREASPQVWAEFIRLRDEGLTRAIGVSNYSVRQIDELIAATGERPAVNQIPWSPSKHDPATLAAMRERGVVLEGYSPLKGSRLRNSVLADIASVHGVTPAQVVLRWHVEHQIPVIPKSRQRERIASNFAITEFSLTPAEVARIDAL
jgi:diketogulonate reductase-like aldo/keto reductase